MFRFAKPTAIVRALPTQQRVFSSAAAATITSVGPYIDDMGEPRFLEQVKLFVDEASAKSKVNPQFLTSIKECNNVLRFAITITRDDGSLEVVPAYR